MKKGKPILATVILGVLTYLAWLGLDLKNPEPATPVATPYELVAETVAPPVASMPILRPLLARKAFKIRKIVPAAPMATTAVAQEPTDKIALPMPNVWRGSLVKHDRPINKVECAIDQPCSPRGRDGVLLVGASFSLSGWKPMRPEILTVGSYGRRTPLLVYK